MVSVDIGKFESSWQREPYPRTIWSSVVSHNLQSRSMNEKVRVDTQSSKLVILQTTPQNQFRSTSIKMLYTLFRNFL